MNGGYHSSPSVLKSLSQFPLGRRFAGHTRLNAVLVDRSGCLGCPAPAASLSDMLVRATIGKVSMQEAYLPYRTLAHHA